MKYYKIIASRIVSAKGMEYEERIGTAFDIDRWRVEYIEMGWKISRVSRVA